MPRDCTAINYDCLRDEQSGWVAGSHKQLFPMSVNGKRYNIPRVNQKYVYAPKNIVNEDRLIRGRETYRKTGEFGRNLNVQRSTASPLDIVGGALGVAASVASIPAIYNPYVAGGLAVAGTAVAAYTLGKSIYKAIF